LQLNAVKCGLQGTDRLGTRGALSHGMAINGVITSKEVVRHTLTIVREFGPRAWLRCCTAMVTRRRTTFLACVFTP
jgi:hypothetical protein